MPRIFHPTLIPSILILFILGSCGTSTQSLHSVAKEEAGKEQGLAEHQQPSPRQLPQLAAQPKPISQSKNRQERVAQSAAMSEAQDASRPATSGQEMAASGSRGRMPSTFVGFGASLHPIDPIRPSRESVDRENYAHFDSNPVRRVAEHPVSTFSIDVDTGSYTNVRRFLRDGRLPVKDAVRVEEMINYFSYAYPSPTDTQTPFRLTTEIAPTPWNPHAHLLHIGIKGYEVPQEELPPANLVFLVDVSGSMQSKDKLELVKLSLVFVEQTTRGRRQPVTRCLCRRFGHCARTYIRRPKGEDSSRN